PNPQPGGPMRVRRSPHLYVEREEAGELHVRERASGNRAVLNGAGAELLKLLKEPREVPAHPQVQRLLEMGFLVEDGREAPAAGAKLFSRVAPSMFGCPAWRPGQAADFIFLGVPVDVFNLTAPGARFGPDGLRQASALYASEALESSSGACRGWV